MAVRDRQPDVQSGGSLGILASSIWGPLDGSEFERSPCFARRSAWPRKCRELRGSRADSAELGKTRRRGPQSQIPRCNSNQTRQHSLKSKLLGSFSAKTLC